MVWQTPAVCQILSALTARPRSHFFNFNGNVNFHLMLAPVEQAFGEFFKMIEIFPRLSVFTILTQI